MLSNIKTREEVATKLKEVVGLVDINNTKQADKKETTDMGKRANHSIANTNRSIQYRGKGRALYIFNSNCYHLAAEVEDIQFRFLSNTLKKKKDIIFH